MSGFFLSPEAEHDLDGIWLYIAHESGNLVIATDVVDKIIAAFGSMEPIHTVVEAEKTCSLACGAFKPINIQSSMKSYLTSAVHKFTFCE